MLPPSSRSHVFRTLTHQVRHLHRAGSHTPIIPPPTPFVPDTQTFLSLIGRDLKSHASKFPTWDSLFSYTSDQLRKAGLEPARSRRYLLWWRDRFRRGIHGPGGDLQSVKDGAAELRVVEKVVLMGDGERKKIRRWVVNVPAAGEEIKADEEKLAELPPVDGMTIKGTHGIVGPFVQVKKGSQGREAIFKVEEGMWEERRGQKVDGGERRKKHVRRQRKLEELRKNRR